MTFPALKEPTHEAVLTGWECICGCEMKLEFMKCHFISSSHIVPGFLVQIIISIIALIKQISQFHELFSISQQAFLFPWWWNTSNAEFIVLSSWLWNIGLGNTHSFSNWSLKPITLHLFQLTIAIQQTTPKLSSLKSHFISQNPVT
jgi:hypothetical protein